VESSLVVPTSMLEQLLDMAISSMDYSSGFMTTDDVTTLRQCAEMLGVDPAKVTPHQMYRDFAVPRQLEEQRDIDFIVSDVQSGAKSRSALYSLYNYDRPGANLDSALMHDIKVAIEAVFAFNKVKKDIDLLLTDNAFNRFAFYDGFYDACGLLPIVGIEKHSPNYSEAYTKGKESVSDMIAAVEVTTDAYNAISLT
jgi:hypothetical protein